MDLQQELVQSLMASRDAAEKKVAEFESKETEKLKLLFKLQDALPVESGVGLASSLSIGIDQTVIYVNKLLEDIKKLEHYPFEPICLLCGRLTPCMTDEEGAANGGPGAPCTFEMTPRELFDHCKYLRKRIKELEDVSWPLRKK